MTDEEHDFEERIAICMFEGGLSEEEAIKIALAQVFDWETARK